MEARLIVAFVLCALIIATPFIVKYIEGYLRKPLVTGGVSTSLQTSAALVSGGVTYLGCGESHSGADYLIVCPSKVYVSSSGSEVRINVTVKFKHAQPCPYSSWKILLENINGAELISGSRTTLVNAYTASKYYVIKVLSNGSVDVVYKYGEGCPYGTEERVHVEFYVVKSLPTAVLTRTTSSAPTETPSELVIKGALQEVNINDKYVVVNNTKVFIKGSWSCNGVEMKWRYLLDELSKLPKGTVVSIRATSEEGNLMAIEISFNNTVCSRG